MANSLIEAVRRFTEIQTGESRFVTPIEGLTILRSNREKPPNHVIFKPALCIVVQGAKWVMFGDRRFDYRAGQAAVVSVEMPLFGRVAEASPSEPYLGVSIEFDLAMMREVLGGLGSPFHPQLDSPDDPWDKLRTGVSQWVSSIRRVWPLCIGHKRTNSKPPAGPAGNS